MNPPEPNPPAPPPDADFCRFVEGALTDGDLALTDRRRAAVLKAFAGAAPAERVQKRRIVHFACWLAAGAAACLALWLSGVFSVPTPTPTNELATIRPATVSQPLTPQPVTGVDRLEQANLRLAVLTEQLSRAEHQLGWLRATQTKSSAR